jgi:hypothetical protein
MAYLRREMTNGMMGDAGGSLAMRHAARTTLVPLALALAAGCSAGHPPAPAGATGLAPAGRASAGQICGTTYTAAHVLVQVQVPRGAVDCALALRVQIDYTRKVSAGEAPGNGGGGPVPVDGWTCEGYPTPQVLQTGRASECHRDGVEFFAVLPAPTATATSIP